MFEKPMKKTEELRKIRRCKTYFNFLDTYHMLIWLCEEIDVLYDVQDWYTKEIINVWLVINVRKELQD